MSPYRCELVWTGDRLEREGVEKFADSYNGAVDTIEAKAKKLVQA